MSYVKPSRLGVQNNPCGHYFEKEPVDLIDAVTCETVEVPGEGVWHLHRYFERLRSRARSCTSPQWVFVGHGWQAQFYPRR